LSKSYKINKSVMNQILEHDLQKNALNGLLLVYQCSFVL
jgi:hypothetical protein